MALSGCGIGVPPVKLPTLGSSHAEAPAQGESSPDRLFASGPVTGAGYVAADEPQAAMIARDILDRGGSAADAAIGLYFGLSVTYPSAAGLGGGGLCLARDAAGAVDSLEFLAKTPPGGGAVAIPGNVRGMAALHARHGQMRWSADVAPAQRLAGTGAVISRALADELAALDNAALRDSAIAAYRTRADGSVAVEGDPLDQTAYVSTLDAIRAGGANAFYRGALARAVVDAANASGGSLTLGDLAAMQAAAVSADIFDLHGLLVAIPSLASGAGQLAATTLTAARDVTERRKIDIALSASMEKLGAPPATLPDYGSTSFLVVDSAGRAVACAVTMNGPFGAGHSVPGTGILLAANPANSTAGYGNAFLDPIIAGTRDEKGPSLVLSSAGDSSALADAIDAIQMSRNQPGSSAREVLEHAAIGKASRINLLLCSGRTKGAGACSVAADPRAHGLASVTARPVRER